MVMLQVVSRALWGARPPVSRQALARPAQRGTAVHYTGMDADEQADHAGCARRVRSIQAFHMDGNGWADIAYSYVACKHGFVFEGRGRGVRTAAQGTDSGNAAFHAVCFLGDDSAGRDDVTDAGREAVEAAVRWCNLWSAASEVRPHSWFHPTGCPGDQLRAWVDAGLPVTAPKEGDMSLNDADRAWLQSAIRREGERLYRLLARAELDGQVSEAHYPDSNRAIRGDTKAVLAAMGAEPAAVELAEVEGVDLRALEAKLDAVLAALGVDLAVRQAGDPAGERLVPDEGGLPGGPEHTHMS
jgi:hypothetical protein